jgi:hypothetical protein
MNYLGVSSINQSGEPGARGPRGFQGEQGLKGDTGDQGIKGDSGTTPDLKDLQDKTQNIKLDGVSAGSTQFEGDIVVATIKCDAPLLSISKDANGLSVSNLSVKLFQHSVAFIESSDTNLFITSVEPTGSIQFYTNNTLKLDVTTDVIASTAPITCSSDIEPTSNTLVTRQWVEEHSGGGGPIDPTVNTRLDALEDKTKFQTRLNDYETTFSVTIEARDTDNAVQLYCDGTGTFDVSGIAKNGFSYLEFNDPFIALNYISTSMEIRSSFSKFTSNSLVTKAYVDKINGELHDVVFSTHRTGIFSLADFLRPSTAILTYFPNKTVRLDMTILVDSSELTGSGTAGYIMIPAADNDWLPIPLNPSPITRGVLYGSVIDNIPRTVMSGVVVPFSVTGGTSGSIVWLPTENAFLINARIDAGIIAGYSSDHKASIIYQYV